MPKIVLDDVKSVYEPLEIEFEGKVYRVREPSMDGWEEIEAIEAQIKTGAIGAFSAIRRQLQLFLGDEPFLGKIDRHQAESLLRGIVKAVIQPQEKEKNGPGPGDAGLP
jgi:hypothetical protein